MMKKPIFLRHICRVVFFAALLVPGWQVMDAATAKVESQDVVLPWKVYGSRSGECGWGENKTIAYSGLNNTGHPSDYSNEHGVWGKVIERGGDGKKAMVYIAFYHTRTLPPYAREDMYWQYYFCGGGNKTDKQILYHPKDSLHAIDSKWNNHTETSSKDSEEFGPYTFEEFPNASTEYDSVKNVQTIVFDNSDCATPRTIKNWLLAVCAIHGSDDDGYAKVGLRTDAYTYNLYYPEFNGAGTAESPLQIGTGTQLRKFATIVNSGAEGTANLHAVLTNDIDYTQYTDKDAMIGTSSYRYKGVFDGQGHTIQLALNVPGEKAVGLFRYVENATIKNLSMAGSVNAKSLMGSVVCYTYGTTVLNQVISSVALTAQGSDDLSIGGLVGSPQTGTLMIKNCAFTGKMLNSNGGRKCGGFVAYVPEGIKTSFTGCYFAPVELGVGTSGSCTFARCGSSSDLTFTNCFYTQSLGTAQGTQVTNEQMASGEVCWRLNDSKSGGSPWLQTLGEDSLPVLWDALMVYEQNGSYFNFQPSFRGAGTEIDPFQIENVLQLEQFRDMVNTGYNTFCAKLVTDIDLANRNWEPMGRGIKTGRWAYEGVFDGNGYIISNLNVNPSAEDEDLFIGLFGRVQNATIKNLIIRNATFNFSYTTSSGRYAAPIAAYVYNNTTIVNCAAIGVVSYQGAVTNSGIATMDSQDGSNSMSSCYSVYSNVSANNKGITNCYYGNDVASKHATGELTHLLNNGDPTPWVQTLGRDDYPLLRGAKSVTKYGTVYVNEEYSGSDEAGYVETTSGKDFRVIHHGGRLYEFIITAGTQDGNGIHILPDANIRHYCNGQWTTILELSNVNADSLAFTKDWWGALNILSGTVIDTRTYDKQVPTFWVRQGNHTDCKQASLLWVAPKTLMQTPNKFELKGAAETSTLSLVANLEDPKAPADDASVSFTDPTIGVTMEGAGHQSMVLTATYNMYAVSVWDATDNRFVTAMTCENGKNSVTVDLPQLDRYHNMVAMAYSKTIETSGSGKSDTTYVNYAYPFVQKPVHSLLRTNASKGYTSNCQLEWAIAFPNDSDMIEGDPYVVARGYKSDYSDYVTLQSFDLPNYTNTTTEHDTLFGWYNYIDNTPVDYTQLELTSDTLSAFDTWNLSESAKAVLGQYKYPAGYVYYQVYRPVVLAMWDPDTIFYKSWKMLLTNVLPTVDSVRVIQDADFDTNHKVTVRVVLNNPYPWDVVSAQDRDAVWQEAVEQHATHRMFNWDSKASILLHRFSTEDEFDQGEDVISKEITITGDQIRQDTATGAYYVEYQDIVSMPFVHYHYKAKVHADDSDYPICESRNKYVFSSEPAYTEEFGGIYNLKATCGSVKGSVEITWEADETNHTTLELRRREYQRGYESTKALADWSTIQATGGIAYDDMASAAVVNEYILSITTRYRNLVFTDADTTYGYAAYYGSLSGRVQMSNGVNMPGNVHVSVNCDEPFILNHVTHPKTGETILAPCHYDVLKYDIPTDANGAYALDSIPYYGTGHTYTAYAACEGATFVSPTGSASTIDLTYEDANYEYTGIDFTCNDTRHFSGRVLFTNSTAPVRDAYIKVNGTILRNAQGEPVVTDAMGNFSFIVPRMEVTIQVVKPGHNLSNEGYILGGDNADQRTFTPTHDYDGLVIDDDTRVRLVGRVAGGDIQGNKPLGFGLSSNNLGDSITLILALEGDHTSYLYFDKQNPDKVSYTQTFTQPVMSPSAKKQGIATQVTFEAKRIIVKADNATGEFCLDLLPTKYVISQVYANGYGSLYSEGEGLMVMDLGDSIGMKTHYSDSTLTSSTEYEASLRKIYHAPVQVDLLQMRNNKFQSIYGAESMDVEMVTGKKSMQLSWMDAEGNAQYALGHPVFKGGNSNYYFLVQAYEPYYYNNSKSGNYQRVPMSNYPVSISNGLNSSNGVQKDGLTLNELGCATFVVQPNNTTFTMTEEDALRYLSASVEINGYHYESDVIAGFVTGEKDFGIEVATAYESMPTIIDYIRDPYGANSYAYREAGTTYSWAHHLSATTMDILRTSYSVGCGIASSIGLAVQQNANYTVKVNANVNFTLTNNSTMLDGEMTMQLKDRLSTSADPKDQGAMADIYLGNISTMDIYHYKTLSVLDSMCWALVRPAVEGGVVKLVSKGRNAKGEPTYLAICNGTTCAMGTERLFAYTQEHIINTLIPSLEARRDEAFRIAKDADEAQKMCAQLGRIVYYPNGNGYSCYCPSTSSVVQDTVKMLNEQIAAWQQLIAANEKIKIDAMEGTPDHAYSVAGTTIEHSEDAFTYYRYRTQEGSKPVTWSVGAGASENNTPKISLPTNGAPTVNDPNANQADINDGNNFYKDDLGDFEDISAPARTPRKADGDGGNSGNSTGVSGYGLVWSINISYQQSSTGSNVYTDYVASTGGSGYTITATDNSYFDIDIYHESDKSVLSVPVYLKGDINSYESGTTDGSLLDIESSGSIQMVDSNSTVHSYIYVMRSGATHHPWLDADSTFFYKPDGERLPLGTRTIRIDNPQIYVENPVAHNTPQDEKAVFTLRLTNETEMISSYEGEPAVMVLKVKENTNPYGAKIFVDGQALGNGLEYSLRPGQAITKTLEVERGGKPYDYENIVLTLSDKSQSIIDEAAINIYYLPTSTPVNLTLPAQNFLINTLSQKDEDGKYYIGVQIEGFSTTKYDNFDHIELQYKRQTDGEDQWVNQCSYFVSDSLYDRATGTKAMITTEGRIANIRFYGEQDPVEQKYDLRAVSFCRLGNGYTTRYSSVISGTKDTRCPEVFGLPKPVDGILSFDDVISLPFTEPIAYNYLDETANFSVQGYTNNSDVDNSVALYFSGNLSQQAITEVDRVLNAMDFSMEAMVKVDADATDTIAFLLIHDVYSADFSKKMAFGYIPQEDQLIFATNSQKVYSKPLQQTYGINLTSAMTHVGMVYTIADSTVHFYVSEQEADVIDASKDIHPVCHANGPVYMGYNMKGKMNNIRLWSKALNLYEMTSKYKKRLSSNEANLLAYWPADEASGTEVKDLSNGATLYLTDVSWSLPDGYSVALDHKTMNILYDQALKYTRNSREDFTISFYFKADALDGDANLFAAGGDALEETGKDKVRIRFIDGVLYLISEGQQVAFGDENDYASDGNWHYLAVSVNHAQNKASLFIDGALVNQLDANNIGGVAGSSIVYGDAAMACHIDQVQMWSMALPASYIKTYYNAGLTGKEKELQIYLPFEQEAMNAQGTMYTTFSPLNQVIVESTGEIAGDTVINPALVTADNKVISPVRSATGIENLPFTWKSTDNELQITINKTNAEINNQHVCLIVRRVEDLNGNPMSNAQMWTTYVNRNVLTWTVDPRVVVLSYGSGTTIAAAFKNASGRELSYTLDCTCPYITLGQTMGTIAPLGTMATTITISDGLAPGVYHATVNLIDEDGLCSALPIYITVVAQAPDWQTTTDPAYNQSMNIIAQVKKQEQGNWVVDMCPKDKVAAFIHNECVGVANLSVDALANTSHLYLTIHGKADLAGQAVEFRLWSALTGSTYILEANPEVTFAAKSFVGADTPVELRAHEMRVQTIALNPGWNWVSLYVDPFADKGLNNLFSNQKQFTQDDIFRTPFDNTFATFQSNGTWDATLDDMDILKDNVYPIYAQNAAHVEVSGSLYADPTVTLDFTQSEWAQMAYLSDKSMAIRQTLGDFVPGSDKAPAGTIIKGYEDFAIATADGTWVGSLEYLRPGEGYFVRRNGLRDALTLTFTNTTTTTAPAREENHQSSIINRTQSNQSPTMMPIIAAFADGDMQEGDILLAMVGKQVVAVSEATDNLFFVSLHANAGETVQFAKVRDGEVVAVTSQGLKYDAEGQAGTVEHPYLIDFSGVGENAPVYDILGLKYDYLDAATHRVLIQGNKKIIKM